MPNWQFNVLFFVGVGGAILLLLGPNIGLHFDQSPVTASGVGAILAYVLTQKKVLTKSDDEKKGPKDKNDDESDDKEVN